MSQKKNKKCRHNKMKKNGILYWFLLRRWTKSCAVKRTNEFHLKGLCADEKKSINHTYISHNVLFSHGYWTVDVRCEAWRETDETQNEKSNHLFYSWFINWEAYTFVNIGKVDTVSGVDDETEVSWIAWNVKGWGCFELERKVLIV